MKNFPEKGGLSVQKNEIFRLTAEKLGAEMEGVCRLDGMPVFVPGLLPGEETDVRIVKTEKRYAFGRMEALPAVPSPDRRDPGCPVYPRCGGCSCRHMRYEATLEGKRLQVRDEPVLGFYAPRSHAVIPAAACPNAMAPAGEIAETFLAWMRRFRIEPYREETHTGLVRHLVIRINRQGESMVTVAINGRQFPHADELAGALKRLNTVSLFWNENTDRTNVILSPYFHIIYGRNTLPDTLCGLRFELSPAAFFQVNPVQTEKLYAAALDFADLKPDETVCDVYCGAGTITLAAASRCASAVGIEIVPAAVENARRNAERNAISNAVFHAGPAEELLPRLVREGLRCDAVLVDPPRKGLEPAVIRAIAEAGPSRVVYVSCNVATQARDAALFRDAGYTVKKVQPVDMFCWTSGIENVALLSRET